MRFRLLLTPTYSLALAPAAGPDEAEGSDLPGATAAIGGRELAAAFAAGAGDGLWRLAAGWPTCDLAPPEAYWRDFAKTYLTSALTQMTSAAAWSEELSGAWIAKAPPLPGGEYLCHEALATLHAQLAAATTARTQAAQRPLQSLLAAHAEAWSHVGKICVSLAENRNDPARPFAAMATYVSQPVGEGRPRHTPLARVLQDALGTDALAAALTATLTHAAAASAVIRDWLDTRRILRPLALTAAEAHAFLREAPAMTGAGLMIRMPDWWNPASPPRPQVSVTVGEKAPATLGAGALFNFRASATLFGKPLSDDEWEKIRAAVSGLVFLRNQWVEVDARRLEETLESWHRAEALAEQRGVTLAQAMRMLVGGGPPAGARGDAGAAEHEAAAAALRPWSEVIAGEWLTNALGSLRDPTKTAAPPLGDDFQAELRPYQRTGLAWLWQLHRLGLGGCLADDMGLGKTLQVLAFLQAMKKARAATGPHLVVAPATLLANWLAEAQRFAPRLNAVIAHPSSGAMAQLAREADAADLIITSYGMLLRTPWLAGRAWDVAILDEAQAIKNPEARQTRATKALNARLRLALTGTPIENRALDLWSLFDFINPGLLGTRREFEAFLQEGDGAFARLRALTSPYILRRLKTDKALLPDLPEKTEVRVRCGLAPVQAALYERLVADLARDLKDSEGAKRKGVILKALMRLKQVCNHPALAVGHGDYLPEASGKLLRLRPLLHELAQRQERVLIFSQFREMDAVLAQQAERIYRQPGGLLHGETSLADRAALVRDFQAGRLPFMVLSLKAGGTGLTLTAASHVVHFDRWWNPAVEDQATDRAYRIGQTRHVLVHKFVCAGTIEAKIAALLESKRGLSRELLSAGGDAALTELSDDELLALATLDLNSAQLEDDDDEQR